MNVFMTTPVPRNGAKNGGQIWRECPFKLTENKDSFLQEEYGSRHIKH